MFSDDRGSSCLRQVGAGLSWGATDHCRGCNKSLSYNARADAGICDTTSGSCCQIGRYQRR